MVCEVEDSGGLENAGKRGGTVPEMFEVTGCCCQNCSRWTRGYGGDTGAGGL